MPSSQIISSCLQHLVELSTSNHRFRRSKGLQKSSKTTTNCIPRIAFHEPIGNDPDTTPLLSASRSNPSMLSAVTTTEVYSLTNAPSILSCISYAKSETRLSAPPFHPHPNIAKSDEPNGDHQSEAMPFVKVHEVSHGLDFSAEPFRLTCAVDKEAALPIIQAADEHEIYLTNLRRLHFGGIAESDGFSLVPQKDDDAGSWEEIDLEEYGWQI